MTCKDLKRLTISDVHKAKSNTERLMNFAYAKDNRVFIPQQYKEDIDLCEFAAKYGCGLTAESVMEGSCFECDLDCVPGILYFCAVQAAELRERLKMFEDKLENGTLIELPCKVGDTVYVLDYEDGKAVDYSGYIFIMANNDFAFLSPVLNGESNPIEICNEYFQRSIDDEDNSGVIVPLAELFLTKAEAEQKLKELQE